MRFDLCVSLLSLEVDFRSIHSVKVLWVFNNLGCQPAGEQVDQIWAMKVVGRQEPLAQLFFRFEPLRRESSKPRRQDQVQVVLLCSFPFIAGGGLRLKRSLNDWKFAYGVHVYPKLYYQLEDGRSDVGLLVSEIKLELVFLVVVRLGIRYLHIIFTVLEEP